ncbi:MAG: polymer-forming cytoskeletal protein [Methanomicrobiales archaeon]|nr:polymer-forming cytoskeletal protein [Methanomicrobiales archaeon]
MDVDVANWMACCYLPDSTELQEHTLKTDRPMVIGDRCQIDYGLDAAEILVCEFCTINGAIVSTGDVRIDNWCEIVGDVVAGQDAYIGEGVKIRGKLVVRGDLDIGDNVQIAKGFEAKGWIVIRNPIPVIFYVLLYLMTMFHLGKEGEVNDAMQELFGDEEELPDPLRIPPGSVLNMHVFSTSEKMEIGSGCRLHGNIRAASVKVRDDTVVFGSLRSNDAIEVGERTTIHGDVVSEGDVVVHRGAHVLGNVASRTLQMHEEARIDGVIRAPDGLRIERTT